MRSDRRRLVWSHLTKSYAGRTVRHLAWLTCEDPYWVARGESYNIVKPSDLVVTREHAARQAGFASWAVVPEGAPLKKRYSPIEMHYGYMSSDVYNSKYFMMGLYKVLSAGDLSLIAAEVRTDRHSKSGEIYDSARLARALGRGLLDSRSKSYEGVNRSKLKYCIKRLRFNFELMRIREDMRNYFSSPMTSDESAVKALLKRVRSAHSTIEGMGSVRSALYSRNEITMEVFTHRGVLCAYEGLLQAHLGRWEMALPQLELARVILGRMIHLEKLYRRKSQYVRADGSVCVNLEQELVDRLLREQLYQNYYRVLDILSQYSEQRARGLSGEAAQAHRIASQLYRHESAEAKRFEPIEMQVVASDAKLFRQTEDLELEASKQFVLATPGMPLKVELLGCWVVSYRQFVRSTPLPSKTVVNGKEVPEEQVALVARRMLGHHLHYDVYYAGRFTVGFIRLMGLASVVAMCLVGASLLWPLVVSLSLGASQGLLFGGIMAGFVSAFCAFKWLWLDAGRLQEEPLPKLSSVTPGELLERSAEVHAAGAKPGLAPVVEGSMREEPDAGIEARESRSPSQVG